MKEVAIIGVGQTSFGVFRDKSVGDLGREAILNAVKDAGIRWRDINYIVGGIDPYSGYDWLLAANTLESSLGYIGAPATNVYNACASGAFSLDIGRALILSGMYEIVLCVGAFKAPGGFFPTVGNADDPYNFDASRFKLLGKTNPTMFGLQAMRRVHNYGMTDADIAQVKVKNSKHGKLNPYARFRKEFTMEEVLASPMVSSPLRLYELAATSDGAAAVIIASTEKAKQLGSNAVRLAAIGVPQPDYPNTDIIMHFATQSQISHQSPQTHTERVHHCQAANKALDEAGVSPKDLSFAEVYDLSTAMEYDWIEDIGICAPGEAEALTRSGATSIGGKIPINPSGGVSCFGEAIPAQALLQTCELVTQLRGAAGPRQVENARVGLAINKGLGHSVSCIIAKR